MQSNAPEWGDPSKVFRLADMPLHRNPNGSESRTIAHGALVTGEFVSLHESTQPAGIPPNPAHTIEHTEFICVRSGSLEFTHNNRTERAEAGDVLLVAQGTLHGVRNVGSSPASYFVVALGGDTH